MTEEVRRLARRRVASDVLAVAVGVAGVAAYALLGNRFMLYVGAYGLLVGTGTAAVTFCLTQFTGVAVGPPDPDEDSDDAPPDDGTTGSAGDPPAGLDAGPWAIFTGEALETEADVREDTGWLIGRLENVIVLTLVLVGEFTALSIIFAAKSWVRYEDIASEDTTYYLAGTLVNFTYSIAAGIAVRLAIGGV